MDEQRSRARGSIGEVFVVFLKLGLTSFGGPIAHLGYFRDELVTRRKWVDDEVYADIVALCQFLPGPASSQVGFTLGLSRAGAWGAAAAWAGFTLPSALLLVLFALGATAVGGPIGTGLIHGLKLVAVAVVAQAVWGMARSLAPDGRRAAIALAALLLVTLVPTGLGQLGAIVLGGVAGLVLCRLAVQDVPMHLHLPVSRGFGLLCLGLFAVLLLGLPLFSTLPGLALFDAFYRSGALVFGGGHVVLPLLQAEVVQSGWMSADTFLTGYGAAQAVPGPLFTFAAYLGALVTPAPNGLLGASIALVAIFLPGFLLLLGALPFWTQFRRLPLAQAGLRGANAAVVGILGAALYNPVWTSAVGQPIDFALAAFGFVALTVWRVPPWLVVLALAACGAALSIGSPIAV